MSEPLSFLGKTIPVSILKFKRPTTLPGKHSVPENLRPKGEEIIINYSPSLRHFILTGTSFAVKVGEDENTDPVLIPAESVEYWRSASLPK